MGSGSIGKKSFLKRMCIYHPGSTTGSIFLCIFGSLILIGGAVLWGFATNSSWEERLCFVLGTSIEGPFECVSGDCWKAVWDIYAVEIHTGEPIWNGTIKLSDFLSVQLAENELSTHPKGTSASCYQQEGPNKWVAPQFKWVAPLVDRNIGLAQGCMIAGGSGLGAGLVVLSISAASLPSLATEEYLPLTN